MKPGEANKAVVGTEQSNDNDCVVIHSEVISEKNFIDLDISKDVGVDWRDDLGIRTSFKFESENTKKLIARNQNRAFYGNVEYAKRT